MQQNVQRIVTTNGKDLSALSVRVITLLLAANVGGAQNRRSHWPTGWNI